MLYAIRWDGSFIDTLEPCEHASNKNTYSLHNVDDWNFVVRGVGVLEAGLLRHQGP